jgi:Tfp pilus assembly protein PilF
MAKKPAKTKQTAKAKDEQTLTARALKCNTAHELINLIKELKITDEEYVFRGVSKIYKWQGYKGRNKIDICSSIFLNYRKKFDFSDNYHPVHIESEIVDDAKTYFPPHASNIEILSDIRHFGGDTTLIDFSKDVLVALFFACQDNPRTEGQLIALPINEIDTILGFDYEKDFGIKHGSTADKSIAKSVDFNKIRLISPIMTATNQARVVAQKSVFIHAPCGYIDPGECVIIPIDPKFKQFILQYLDQFHDINQRSIYNDLHGLIDSQKHTFKARLNLFKGNKFLAENDNNSAKWRFTQAIRLKRDYAKAYNSRSLAYSQLGKDRQAIIDLNKAIRLKPDYADAYYNRGLLQFSLNKYDEAIADFSKVIELNPRDAEAYNSRGISKYELKQYQGAMKDLTKAIQLDQNYADAHYNRGLVKMNAEDDQRANANDE